MTTQAGSIGFTMAFTRDAIALTHAGSESAYQLTMYTLDAETKWRLVSVVSGDTVFVTPGTRIQARRAAAAPSNALGLADPLLLLFRDQSGNDFAQLAWRQIRPPEPYPLLVVRQGVQLQVQRLPLSPEQPSFSYAIAIPYAGIERLEHPYQEQAIPPNPVVHAWSTGSPLALNSGAGQAGAWLLHQYPQGEVRMQIVPEGKLRGQEQQAAWLSWSRVHMMQLAAAATVIGAMALFVGLFWRRTRSSAVAAR